MSSTADDISLALQLADQADALTMERFGALDLRIETKPDLTPVTDADRGAEEALRTALSASRPGDALLGEEYGGTAVFAGRQWVLDPIVDGVPEVGVVSAPALRRRWWAGSGEGAFTSFDGVTRRISVSGVDDVASASLSYSDLTGWGARRSRFLDLVDAVWRVRGYGDFWSYCLLAEGAVDIVAEPEVKLWDLAPLDVLIREAGGLFTNLEGSPGPHGGSAVATNGLLHDRVLSSL
jgi:histidinol-phosphatase